MQSLIIILFILASVVPAWSQTSICDSLGQPRLAVYRDTAVQPNAAKKIEGLENQLAKHPEKEEQIARKLQALMGPKKPKTNCPKTASAIDGFCYEFATVGFCNSMGLGSCNQFGNRYTQECFNAQVCLQSVSASPGGGVGTNMCVTEALAADATISDAPSCSNMTGSWNDNYGETFTLVQEEGSPFVNGSAEMRGKNGVSCGTWTVTGTVVDNFNMSLTMESPIGPVPGSCCSVTSFNGSLTCGSAFGTWTNPCGHNGSFDMKRGSIVPIGNVDISPATDTTCDRSGTWVNNRGETITFSINGTSITGEGQFKGRGGQSCGVMPMTRGEVLLDGFQLHMVFEKNCGSGNEIVNWSTLNPGCDEMAAFTTYTSFFGSGYSNDTTYILTTPTIALENK